MLTHGERAKYIGETELTNVKPTVQRHVNLMWVWCVPVCGLVFAVMMVCLYEAIDMIRVGQILREILLMKTKNSFIDTRVDIYITGTTKTFFLNFPSYPQY